MAALSAFAFSSYGCEAEVYALRGGLAMAAYNARKGKMGFAVYNDAKVTVGWAPTLKGAQALLAKGTGA